MWSCPRCTFENHDDLVVCELCESEKGNRISDFATSSSSSSSIVKSSAVSSTFSSGTKKRTTMTTTTKFFSCEQCHYKCNKPSDFNRHLSTRKHILTTAASTTASTTASTATTKERRKAGRSKEEFKKGTMLAFRGGGHTVQGNDCHDYEILLGKIEIYDRGSITDTCKMCFVQIFDQVSPTVFAKSATKKDLVLIDLEKCNDRGEKYCQLLSDAFIRYDNASKCYNTTNSLSTLFDGTSTSKSSVEVRKGLAKIDDDTGNFKRGTFKHVLLGGNPLELGLKPKTQTEEEEEIEKQEKNDVGVYDKKTKRIRFNASSHEKTDDEVSKFISHKNYIGVYTIHTGEQRERAYKAVYRVNNRQHIVPGIFQTSVEAARAYDEHVICHVNNNYELYRMNPPLNFVYDENVEIPLLYTVADNDNKGRKMKCDHDLKRKNDTVLDIEEEKLPKATKIDTFYCMDHHNMGDIGSMKKPNPPGDNTESTEGRRYCNIDTIGNDDHNNTTNMNEGDNAENGFSSAPINLGDNENNSKCSKEEKSSLKGLTDRAYRTINLFMRSSWS